MRIATWNVNSVKARLPNILEWVRSAEPAVLLLQEIKCETEAFPALEFEALGYRCRVLGQKTYNGVAILSRYDMTEVQEGLAGGEGDSQARYLEATVQGIRVASLYLPNGNPRPGDKYDYKLSWMKRLEKRAIELLATEKPVVLGGDCNIIPEDQDVYDPQAWKEDALFCSESRTAWRKLMHHGYTDAFRALHPEERHAYSFWDYQAGAWPRDAGLRIDHFLLSPEAVDRLISCQIDRGPRGKDKASDHTPVILEIQSMS